MCRYMIRKNGSEGNKFYDVQIENVIFIDSKGNFFKCFFCLVIVLFLWIKNKNNSEVEICDKYLQECII